LENGKIRDDFKRQMFYTFGDYRDLCLGKDIGSDVIHVENNISSVFQKAGQTSGQKRKNFWERYGKDIWDGMVCGLSYASERKEAAQTQLITNSDYTKVSIIGGFNGDSTTKLEKFASRPQFIRWLEEWGEEFCRKRKIRIDKIKVDCRGKYEQNYCDGDGFDCSEIGPNTDGSFSTFKC
ncbi:duffy binding-like domain-containing protein, partial [Streptococcus australis]|uniref:duffy binding-like domain-containing protein n=1 Tax=Streptococcus australis TaxID=113107 RepID=UPI001CBE2049|nr:duffy binding-like domain-containing protein [Streptococcus australis]